MNHKIAAKRHAFFYPSSRVVRGRRTCTVQVLLPEYSSRGALRRQLLIALEEMQRGGGFGSE